MFVICFKATHTHTHSLTVCVCGDRVCVLQHVCMELFISFNFFRAVLNWMCSSVSDVPLNSELHVVTPHMRIFIHSVNHIRREHADFTDSSFMFTAEKNSIISV